MIAISFKFNYKQLLSLFHILQKVFKYFHDREPRVFERKNHSLAIEGGSLPVGIHPELNRLPCLGAVFCGNIDDIRKKTFNVTKRL